MNLTQFFDATIKLQKYGYKINFIDEGDKIYFVRFSYGSVCFGLAFGGIDYELQITKDSVISDNLMVRKIITDKDMVTIKNVSNIDEAIDFIIADIQKIEEEVKEKERQKVLDKLTQRERELLGI